MNIAVIGSGKRQHCLGKMLESCGHTVFYATKPECNIPFDPDIAVLPVPSGRDSEVLADKLTADCIVFGWNVPYAFKRNNVFDFATMDHVAKLNAVATAEGCIAELIIHGVKNIAGSKCLITGYGRCAKEISSRLQALGAFVTVAAADRTAREEAACHGMNVSNMFERDSYTEYDYVINTVPAIVIGRREVEKLNDDVVIIDIASSPGGTDFTYCREHGIKAIHSLGLPGRYSPETSGVILGNAIIKVIDELSDE